MTIAVAAGARRSDRTQGAEVTGVDSEAKLAMLSTLGADHVLDCRAHDYTQSVQRYDFILDCELHRSPLDCCRVLTPNGRLAVVASRYLGYCRRSSSGALAGTWTC